MRLLLIASAALLCTIGFAAQGQDETYPSAEAALEAFTSRLQAQQKTFRAGCSQVESGSAYQKAREADDRDRMRELLAAVPNPDRAGLSRSAIEVADGFDGDGAVRLLAWAAIHSRDKAIARDVVQRIEEKHLNSAALTYLLERADQFGRSLGARESGELWVKIAAETPHDLVRAWALYYQAGRLTRRDPDAASEMRKQALELAEGHWLFDRIRGPEFKKERLQIGMVAPDIEGEDMDGVSFRLSDYRGKVVLLDFWGFW